MIITGRCYCGRVRYRASGPPKFQGNCHCKNCRRAAGAQAVAWRTFWTACGTSLTFETPKRPKDIDITTGSLDHPERFPPNRDFFVEERIPWVKKVK
jgi:hypothetical protein